MFGPVLVATSFADEAEAVRLANGTVYGLVAGIWTRRRRARDPRRPRGAGGQVFVNCYGAGGGIEPLLGGLALGPRPREGVRGLVAFTTTRTLIVAQN